MASKTAVLPALRQAQQAQPRDLVTSPFVAYAGEPSLGRRFERLTRIETQPKEVFELTAHASSDGRTLAETLGDHCHVVVYARAGGDKIVVLSVKAQVAEWLPLAVDGDGFGVERLRLYGAKYARSVVGAAGLPREVRMALGFLDPSKA